MIEPQKRKAIFLLHKDGMGIKDISRRLEVSRNTVRTIVKQQGNEPDLVREDKIIIEPHLLRKLYSQCNGYIKRVHEKLTEEEGVEIAYSTLVRMMSQLGISKPSKKRCDHVPDEPGVEMQNDTSTYKIKIGDKQRKVVASIIYFRYSKVRYLKFYRSFNRFQMKCFFHEALSFFGYTAKVCIIDNTNLARLRGSGKNAIIVPEMLNFGKRYGFEFVCHEINHANRKAGNERSFYTTETNFFPGRRFESLEDLNRQAFGWSTNRIANRPVGRTGLIPAKAFEFEQSYLVKLLPFIEPPYCIHNRIIDKYGYVMFGGNFYWVPEIASSSVSVFQYDKSIKIYQNRKLLLEYKLAGENVKNQNFSPDGLPKPKNKPNNRKKPTEQEEQRLRTASPEVNTYLDFALKSKGIQKHRFIRELFALHQKIVLPLFIKTLKRALKYSITDLNTVERIAKLLMRQSSYQMVFIEINEEFKERLEYLEGRLSDDVDLSIYDKLGDEDNG